MNTKHFTGRKISVFLVSLICLSILYNSLSLSESVTAQPYDRASEVDVAIYHQQPQDALESMGMMSLFSLPTTSDFNLGFESDLSGWETHGVVSVSEYSSIQAGSNHWEVWPKNNKMAVMQPSGSAIPFSTVASILNISSSSQSYFLSNFPNPTDFAYIYKDISLNAGQIYYVAWNYVATDYEPFNDASFFTLSNLNNSSAHATINGITTDVSLLGATVKGTGNYSTGSYGSTGWQNLSFKANETSSYRIGFMVFNLDDTALPPVLFVDDGPGIVKNNGVVFEPIGEDPNAPPPPVPDTTPPSLTAGAVSRTSDTSATVKFTTDENGSYYYAVVDDGVSTPTINTDGTGTNCTTGEVTITNPTGLTAGAKDIYIKVKDNAGNVSTILQMDIDAYQTAKANQAVNFDSLPNKTYGDPIFTLVASASSGLPVAFISSDPTIASISDDSVLIHKPGTVIITATQSGNDSFYEASAQQSLTIDKLAVQVINTSVSSKEYDGTTTATLIGATLKGHLKADDVVLSQSTTGTFDSSAVGEQKAVTTYFTLTGPDSEKYTLSQPLDLKGNIVPRSVTVTAETLAKTYGNNDPVLSYSLTTGSLVSGDLFSGVLTRIAGETVGTYEITQGTLQLNDNYNLSFIEGSLEITKRSVTISADAKMKVYGNEDPTLTYQITEGSLAFQDAFTGALTRTIGETVGNYDITQGSVALNDNYTLSIVKGNLEITKRPITIVADAKTKVYGNDDPALTYQITEGSLAFQDAFAGGLTRATGETVGNYDITQGSVALNSNYNLSFVSGSLEITQRPIIITADAKTKVYGNDDPALTYQITEGSLAFQDAFSGTLTRATDDTVGNYDITQGSVALNDNYTLSFVKGNLEVTKRPITITADAKTKVYGNDDPALTYQITEGSLAFQDAFTGALTRANGETVGNYDITQGSVALNSNYNLSFVKGNLEITQRPVTITADAKTKVYGNDDPALTYQITEGSLAFQDAFSGALTRATGEAVGNYDITQGSVALNDNYNLSFVKGNLEITQRPITITADAKTKVYGNDDPALTYQITEGSLAFQDTFSGTLTRATGENVGNYDITKGSVALNDNYNLSFVKGNLEITQRPITITADDKTKVYGNEDPELTYQVTTMTPLYLVTSGNLVFQDTFTGSLTREAGETVGNYDITQGSMALNSNYNLSFVKGNLEITQRPVTITADAKTKVYGNDDPALTYQITEGSLAFQDAFAGGLTRATGETVGNYDITQGSVALNSNYNLSFVKGNLEITKRPVTITADAKTKVYGNDDPALTYQITEGSLAFQDAFSGALTRATGEAVGNYDITQGSVALNSNYNLSFVKGNLEITQRPVTITADAKTKVYGNDDPALTYQITEGSLAFQDAFTGALTRANGETVGNYDITQGSVALNDNYTLSFVKGNLEITKRPITITADAQSKIYGNADPALSYRITQGELAYDDTFQGGLDRDSGDDVGTYRILQGTLNLNQNYDLTFQLSSLEITPRSLTITIGDAEKNQNSPDPRFTYEVTSGTVISSDSIVGSPDREQGELPGSYTIHQGTIDTGPNYDVYFVTGTLTIQPEDVPISKDNVEVIINGNVEQIGKQTLIGDDEKPKTLLLTVDTEQALKRIDELQKKNEAETETAKNTFLVPVNNVGSTPVKVNLTGDVVKNLEEGQFDVQIQSGNITYNVPAQEFSIMQVANRMNVSAEQLRSIEIETTIQPVSEAATQAYRSFVEQNNNQLVFPPVAFHIEAKTEKQDGTTESVTITQFTNYVNRTIELPANTDPKLVTTGIIFHDDGTYSHVPTTVYQLNGKWYANINSLTNSEYALIFNSVTVPAVANHWSKSMVEDMAARLVLVDVEHFSPDAPITRSEFADYIVRALGLYRKEKVGSSSFLDVDTNHQDFLVIEIAHRYGIIHGYNNGTFQPDQLITRQEAMTMYSRAMEITQLVGTNALRFQQFEDFSEVSTWAAEYVKSVVAAGVFNGTSSQTLSPLTQLTHAESLTAIRNLLVKSNLINQ